VKNYSYSKYSKAIAYAETGSPRQVKRLRANQGENFYELTEAERKKLKRSQFAFGSIYPYIFDGLAYIATYRKELFKEYGKELITDAGDYHFQVKLPLKNFIHYCLLNWTASKKYLKEELRRYISGLKNDEQKDFRCIPISKGNYVLTQPLIISFHYKSKSKMSELEVQRLKQIYRSHDEIKIIQDIAILIAKPLLNSILYKGVGSGWFSVPSALQAKIDAHLDLNHNTGLTSLFLRKYYLYLNTLDGSTDNLYMFVDAVDLWEHISPSEVKIIDGKYKYIANWNEAKAKLKSAHRFFQELKMSGIMSGSKLQPAIDAKFPDGLFAYRKTQQYKVCYTRGNKFNISEHFYHKCTSKNISITP
jgi:hypothetical protein